MAVVPKLTPKIVEEAPFASRRRHLSTDEYRRLGQAIAQARGDAALPESALSAVELLIYTGCRPGEVLGLRWEWVDLDAKQIRLPKAKADRPGKRHRGRVIWLNEAATQVLVGIERQPGSPFVFVGSEADKPLRSIRRVWNALCQIASIERATPYCLRHSFVSEGVPFARETPAECSRVAMTRSLRRRRQIRHLWLGEPADLRPPPAGHRPRLPEGRAGRSGADATLTDLSWRCILVCGN